MYLSVTSGIEAATVAWHGLAWKPVAFSEIDKYASAVLMHHYPQVPNWGDMTTFQEWPDATVDLLVGGTPCQSFSVAGLRRGLADPRGSLMLTYLAIAKRYRPTWVVWENVPGVLSSNGGRDFGTFLGGLGELGYGFAYRVLDAQYFGVAQRRRRVFVVGHLGDWRRAAAVLFERASLSGHPAPSREAGKGVAGTISPGAHPGGFNGQDAYNGMLTAHTLRASGFDASEDGTGRGTPLVPVAFDARQSDVIQYGEKSGPLNTDGHSMGIQTAMQVRRLTLRECERLQGFSDDYTLIPYGRPSASKLDADFIKYQMRGNPKHLTRDDITRLAADGPRYKALGNSMAVPVMAWIGRRIQMVGDFETLRRAMQ